MSSYIKMHFYYSLNLVYNVDNICSIIKKLRFVLSSEESICNEPQNICQIAL